jgi:hypothetical protein
LLEVAFDVLLAAALLAFCCRRHGENHRDEEDMRSFRVLIRDRSNKRREEETQRTTIYDDVDGASPSEIHAAASLPLLLSFSS